MRISIITAAAVICSTAMLYSQKSSSVQMKRSLEKGQNMSMKHVHETANRGGGGTFLFTEDFNGAVQSGNSVTTTNGSMWTVEDSGGGSIWMVATAESPAGAYSNPAEALQSTTASNGWMIFDADLYQGGEITDVNPAEDVTGTLTSPVIDLSAAQSVILEFEQTFRYCCAGAKPMFIEVTNDGVNWVAFNAANSFTGGANDYAGGSAGVPLVTTIDISAVAAGESFVMFRFSWGTVGHSHYYWGVDDIALYENPITHDIQTNLITNGDIFADYEYRCLALEQAITPENGGLIIGAVYQNNGTYSENASLTAEVLDSNMNVISSTVVPLIIPSNAESATPGDPLDTIYVATEWAPAESGKYYVRTTFEIDSVESDSSNNSLMKHFLVSDEEYGHDDPELIDTEIRPINQATAPNGPFEPTGVGAYVTIPNEGSVAGGLSVRFDNSTDDLCPINALLYQRNSDYMLSDGEIFGLGFFDVDPNWVPNTNGQNFPVYLPFEDLVDLIKDSSYFYAVQTQYDFTTGDLELAIKATNETDGDYSNGYWAQSTTNDYMWFFGQGSLTDRTPAVRLVLDVIVNQPEMNLPDIRLALFPNPATNQIQTQMQLEAATYVAWEIRNTEGKLIKFDNIGQFKPGTNVFVTPIEELASGNYIMRYVFDGERAVSRSFAVQK